MVSISEGGRNICKDLRKYAGSRQEKLIQSSLTKLMKGVVPEYINLVIQSCNALQPVSFSNASMVVKDFIEIDDCEVEEEAVILYFSQLFDETVMTRCLSKELLSMDMKATDSLAPALLVLLDFFHSKNNFYRSYVLDCDLLVFVSACNYYK